MTHKQYIGHSSSIKSTKWKLYEIFLHEKFEMEIVRNVSTFFIKSAQWKYYETFFYKKYEMQRLPKL